MPKKADEEKMDGRLMVALPQALLDDLTAVAKSMDSSGPQELLRRAARAIVRCAEENKGIVPSDMQIIQRPIGVRLASATEHELGEIIQERLKAAKFQATEAGQLAADLAAEITRRAAPDRPTRKEKKG